MRSTPFLPAALALLVTAGSAEGQQRSTLSITYRSPTIAVPSPTPITEGDILTPTLGGVPAYGPLAPPTIFLPGGPPGGAGLGLPLWAACVGHPPGFPCGVEVDALSFGADFPVTPAPLHGRHVRVLRRRVRRQLPRRRRSRRTSPAKAPCGDSAADIFEDLGCSPRRSRRPARAPCPGAADSSTATACPARTGPTTRASG